MAVPTAAISSISTISAAISAADSAVSAVSVSSGVAVRDGDVVVDVARPQPLHRDKLIVGLASVAAAEEPPSVAPSVALAAALAETSTAAANRFNHNRGGVAHTVAAVAAVASVASVASVAAVASMASVASVASIASVASVAVAVALGVAAMLAVGAVGADDPDVPAASATATLLATAALAEGPLTETDTASSVLSLAKQRATFCSMNVINY